MKKFPSILLSLLSGLLLYAAWPVSPLTFLIFVAWIPLLWLEAQGIRRKKFFGWTYLTMVTWNAAATWWIWNASAPGAAGAILTNSLLMTLPWLAFHFVKSRMGAKIGYASLLAAWMTFEYIHLHDWGLSWPWLTLGNAFATHPGWVQWYEITGTSGGTAWILIVNILLFQLLRKFKSTKGEGNTTERSRPNPHPGSGKKMLIAASAAALVFPLLISLFLGRQDQTPAASDQGNIVIIQPNIDPYEKIAAGSFDAMLEKLIRISDSAIDANTRLVIWPETALYMENPIPEDHLKENLFLGRFWDFLRRHPRINLLSGMESFRYFDHPNSPTSEPVPGSSKYFESYNTAAIFDSSGPAAFYHKTMLVPGVETLPSFLHILDAWFEKFGGTTGGYTGQPDRTVLTTTNGSYRIAPSVCYESIYGEFMSRYVRNGADIIAVITNDAWWGNTPGYHQHENYARLRSIETRRWLVRSANTGISCVISPNGTIIDPQPWGREAFIKMAVPITKEKTFYVRYGDIPSPLAVIASILIFLGLIVKLIKKRQPQRG